MLRLLILGLCSLSFSLSAQYLSDLQEDFDYYQRVVRFQPASQPSITPETFALLKEVEEKLKQRDTSRFEAVDWLLYQNIYLAVAEMPMDYRKTSYLEALAQAVSVRKKLDRESLEGSLNTWWYYSRDLLHSLNQALEVPSYDKAATHLIILSEIQDLLQEYPDALISEMPLGSYAEWLGGELSRLYADLASHFRKEEQYEMAADMLNFGHHFYPNSRVIHQELVALYLATQQNERAKLHLSILIREHESAPVELRKRWYFQRGTLHLQPPMDYGIAQLSFEQALALDPDYFEALFNLAQTYIALSNGALQAWKNGGEGAAAYEQQYHNYLAQARSTLKKAQKLRDSEQISRLLEQLQEER